MTQSERRTYMERQLNSIRDCLLRIETSKGKGELPSGYDILNAFSHVREVERVLSESSLENSGA